MSTTEPQSEPQRERKAALIYVPGLTRAGAPQSVDVIARKVATALEHTSPAPASFAVREAKDEEYGAETPRRRARVRTVTKTEGGKESSILDIYELDYGDQLTKRFEQTPLLGQVAVLLATLIATVPRHLAALRRASKSFGHKLQMIWATLILASMAAYCVVLLVGLWVGARSLTIPAVVNQREAHGQASGSGAPAGTPASPSHSRGLETPLVQAILILGGVGAFSKASAKEVLRLVAVEYVCVISYLRTGRRRAASVGQALALLDSVAAKSPGYERLRVMGYSFGSLVAVDTLFDENATQAGLTRVDGLVTIGCPFDLVRAYWPGYFQARHARTSLTEWINVYGPTDVLGSNFRDDVKEETATAGIQLASGTDVKPLANIVYGRTGRNPNVFESLMLEGFKAHRAYWDAEHPDETSCFDLVAKQLVSIQ